MIAKGHSPNIDDSLLQRSLQLRQDLKSGLQISLSEVPAKEAVFMRMFKGKISKYKQQEAKSQMNQGRR